MNLDNTVFEALQLVSELDAAFASQGDPFPEYPWEHLGDAEKDVLVLMRGLRAAEKELREYEEVICALGEMNSRSEPIIMDT